MRFTQSTRIRIAVLSLISLLFMQVSVSAYACAAWVQDALAAQAAAEGADEAEEGCAGMDEAQALLCHAHCHGHSLSADVAFPPPLALPAIDPLGSAVFERIVLTGALDLPAEPFADLPLTRILAPPDRILNCCLLN